jgi:amicyanin
MATRGGGPEHAVQIVAFGFSPAELTIAVGDTVTWTNLDPVAHTATSTSGAFDSGDLVLNDSFSFTFTAAGTYDYLCTPHPEMTGRIVVQAAVGGPTPTPTPNPATPSLPNAAMGEPGGPSMATMIAIAGLAACAAAVSLERRRRT